MESRYIIEGPVGEGGSGSVFSAWDQQLGRQVAIKRIREGGSIEANIRKEAGILAALHHPNIVSIYDLAADEKGPFVVMELVEGRTLDSVAFHRPLPLSTFLEIADQVCRGLSDAHSRGLIHHDLKPSNIMLQQHHDGSFTVKILDFGLATVTQEEDLEDEAQNEPDEGVLGTVDTIAPEQLLGQPGDVRSDIYSLGCVFYVALSGRYPFEAEDEQSIVKGHLRGQIIPLHLINPKIPEPISRLVSKMLALDPDKRPQTAEEVRISIAHSPAHSDASASPRPHPHPASAPEKKPKNSSVPGLALTVASLLIIVSGWLYYDTPFNPFHHSRGKPSTTPAPAQSPAQSERVRIDPLDDKAVEQNIGQNVVVEGRVVSCKNSMLFRCNYLTFSDSDSTLVVSISDQLASEDRVHLFVGKRVRASGQIVRAAGVTRLVIESLDQIEPVD